MSLFLLSPSFKQGELIPEIHSYKSGNLSPSLLWNELPLNTRTFALTCIDPESNYGTFIHWVIFNIAGTVTSLPANLPHLPQLADGSKQAMNDYGKRGYGGPNPPKGQKHRYVFKLYALDSYLDQFDPDTPSAELIKFFEEHSIAQAELFGYYQGT